MVERDHKEEAKKITTAEIFEHLFPGNQYGLLPRADVRNAEVIWKVYWSKNAERRMHMANAILYQRDFAERENISHPDRLTLAYYTHGLEPLYDSIHPVMFRGHLFTDLIDRVNGERLGGVATRKVGSGNLITKKLSLSLGVDPFLEKPEFVFGILNSDNKPCGLIHFIEGPELRKPERADKLFTQVDAVLNLTS